MPADALGLAVGDQRRAPRPDQRHLVEAVAAIAPVEKRRVADVAGEPVGPRSPISTSRSGIGVGQRPQQHGVQHAEDRRVGADAERERQQRDRRRSRVRAAAGVRRSGRRGRDRPAGDRPLSARRRRRGRRADDRRAQSPRRRARGSSSGASACANRGGLVAPDGSSGPRSAGRRAARARRRCRRRAPGRAAGRRAGRGRALSSQAWRMPATRLSAAKNVLQLRRWASRTFRPAAVRR